MIGLRIWSSLGLASLASFPNTTTAGVHPAAIFLVSLAIVNPTSTSLHILSIPNLLVADAGQALAHVDVLVGRDVLSDCVMIYDGPGQRLTLCA